MFFSVWCQNKLVPLLLSSFNPQHSKTIRTENYVKIIFTSNGSYIVSTLLFYSLGVLFIDKEGTLRAC